jgi:DNA-binding transcriptional LysR family regulator
VNIENIDLRDLRYFIACLDCQGISKAARQLHVSQPTLSHALRRIEDELGQPILARSRVRGIDIQPTRIGSELSLTARDVLARLQRFADTSDADGPLRGEIRIASIQSLNLTLLPPVLSRFTATAPDVSVTLHTLEADAVSAVVQAHKADLGLVAVSADIQFDGVISSDLFDERLVVIVRKDDVLAEKKSVSLRTISKRDLVLPPANGVTGGIIHSAFRLAGLKPRVRLSLSSGEALRAMVREGLGATILPEGYLPPDDPHLTSVTLINPSLIRHVRLLQSEHWYVDRVMESFIDHLRKS